MYKFCNVHTFLKKQVQNMHYMRCRISSFPFLSLWKHSSVWVDFPPLISHTNVLWFTLTRELNFSFHTITYHTSFTLKWNIDTYNTSLIHMFIQTELDAKTCRIKTQNGKTQLEDRSGGFLKLHNYNSY